MPLFLALILLNLMFPTVIGVDMGEQLPVVDSYRVSYIMVIEPGNTDIYDIDGAVMLQTCEGDKRLIVVAEEVE